MGTNINYFDQGAWAAQPTTEASAESATTTSFIAPGHVFLLSREKKKSF